MKRRLQLIVRAYFASAEGDAFYVRQPILALCSRIHGIECYMETASFSLSVYLAVFLWGNDGGFLKPMTL